MSSSYEQKLENVQKEAKNSGLFKGQLHSRGKGRKRDSKPLLLVKKGDSIKKEGGERSSE